MKFPIDPTSYEPVKATLTEVSDQLIHCALVEPEVRKRQFKWRIAAFDNCVWMNAIGANEWALTAFERDGQAFICIPDESKRPFMLTTGEFRVIAPKAILETLSHATCLESIPLPPSSPPCSR